MDDSYTEIFINSAVAQGDVLSPLALLFLFLGRFLPIIAQAPFFGARVLPHPVKVTFALTMFIIFLPHLLTVTTTPVHFDSYLIVLLAKEIFIGFLLGFMFSMPFMVVQNAGIIIDHQRGGASLMVNDPTIQNQSSPLGTLFNYMMILIFWMIDAPFLVLELVSTSYTVIPPNEFFNTQFFMSNNSFWILMFQLFNRFMKLSIQLATPALLSILMTDAFLGIANRLAPQVQITFLGMPLKSLLALVVVAVGFKLFNEEIAKQAMIWMNTIASMIQMFNPEKLINP
ncbi:MAG: flagellar biosynthetic protein FliR [Parachlamydiaceae bacterium]|nr:flagellar biosynthetic protein FliR [Parachlamydiaceae bacterium]